MKIEGEKENRIIMRKYVLAAIIASLALLFVSCQEKVDHTGDQTKMLYGIWALKTKTEAVQTSDGVSSKDVDYTNVHFYLTLSEFPFPHAIAKKGSFTDLDLDDVDVDAVGFTYNQDQKKISFKKRLWLSDDLLTYNMILDGTFDVLELSDNSLVLRQESTILKTTTTYTFQRNSK